MLVHTLPRIYNCPNLVSTHVVVSRQANVLGVLRTFAKYLQGVSTVEMSVECEKGHAFPAWHWPVLKNLQGTCEVSIYGSGELHSSVYPALRSV